MKSFKFVGAIYILKVVCPELAALSKAFQRGTINFGHIVPAINHTTDNKLTKITQEVTPITQLQDDVQESGRLGTCDLQNNKYEVQVLRNLLRNYVLHALKQNITKKRFKDSMAVVSAINIFNPTAIPNRGMLEFTSYGCKETATLTEQYFPNDEES